MKYYMWSTKAGDDACSVLGIQNVSGNVDLCRAQPRLAEFPDDAYFQMDPDYPNNVKLESQVDNRESVLLVSANFAQYLQGQDLNEVEFLPVSIHDQRGGVAANDYKIVHPCLVIDCIDKEASDLMWNVIDPDMIAGVYELVFDESVIPEGTLIFRAKHLEYRVFIREDLVEAIGNEKFAGTHFIPMDEVSI